MSAGEQRRAAIWLVAFFLCLYSLTFSARPNSPDEFERLSIAQTFVETGSIRQAVLASRTYPVLSALAAAPFITAVSWIAPTVPAPDRVIAGCLILSLLASVTCVVLFYRIGLALGYSWRVAATAAFLFGLTTMLWPYSKRFYGENVTALLGLGATATTIRYIAHERISMAIAAGTLLCLLILNQHTAALFVPAVAFAMFGSNGAQRLVPGLRRQWRAAAVVGLGATAGVGLVLWIIHVRSGSVLNTGYPINIGGDTRSGWATPLHIGLLGLTVSPGKGLLFYEVMVSASLFAWRAFYQRHRRLSHLIWIVGVSFLLLYAKWSWWYGGGCWGPRYLIPVAPLLALPLHELCDRLQPAGAWKGRALLGGATVLGLLVQLGGASFWFRYDQRYWPGEIGTPYVWQGFTPAGGPYLAAEPLEWWAPAWSPLWRHLYHFVAHPADLDWALATIEEPAAARVMLTDGSSSPVRVAAARVNQTGMQLERPWSVSEIYGVTAEGTVVHPLTAAASHRSELAALTIDGDPETRWSHGEPGKRADQWIEVAFGNERADVRLASLVVVRGRPDEGPRGLRAEITEDRRTWRVVPTDHVAGARPALRLHPAAYLLLGSLGSLLIVARVKS